MIKISLKGQRKSNLKLPLLQVFTTLNKRKGIKMSNNKTISDIIEEFIMSSLDDDDFIELSRNDLAKFFSCVPSQINYVLNTRFTVNRGFVVESQRGGGGYIKLMRVQDNDNNFLKFIHI